MSFFSHRLLAVKPSPTLAATQKAQELKAKDPIGITESRISFLLQLRKVVRAIPNIRGVIAGRRSQILASPFAAE